MQNTKPVNQTGMLGKALSLMARHQQTLKWTVYTLLILNFGYYLFDDWRAASTTLSQTSSFLEFTAAFATTFDELGWFVIIFLLEVETYWMEDDDAQGFIYWLMQAVRLLCYVVVTHTLYAFLGTVGDLGDATVLSDIEGVCSLVGEDLSFLRNLLYDPITASNCASLSAGGEIFRLVNEPSVTDAAGYNMAIRHAWIDVIEISGWLSVSILITIVMLLQDRGIFSSAWIRAADRLQIVIYMIIAGTAFYWSVYGFYVYTWDILLWIGGFMAINANLAQWRDELKEESGR